MAARKKAEAAEPQLLDGEKSEESLESLIGQIDAIVSRMESEGAPLEASIRDFEEGMALTRRAQALLDHAEQRVEILLADDGGAQDEAPEDARE